MATTLYTRRARNGNGFVLVAKENGCTVELEEDQERELLVELIRDNEEELLIRAACAAEYHREEVAAGRRERGIWFNDYILLNK